MKTEKEIKEYLLEFFEQVYCDTCRHVKNENICEDCERKSMNWGLSNKSAETIVNEIFKGN